MVMNITEMIIDSKSSTPTEPTMIDTLLEERSQMSGLKDGAVVNEDVDVHGIIGQNLLRSVGDFKEHPEW